MRKFMIKDYPQTGVTTDRMKIGDVAIIQDDPDNGGSIIMRHYDGFVALNDPNKTWGDSLALTNMLVNILPKGTVIEFVV